MASFGGVDLGAGGFGVFELTSASDDEAFEHEAEDGSIVIIPPSSRYIVVRECVGVDFEETLNNARKAADRAVDVYFCQSGRPLIVASKDSPYIVGWKAMAGHTLRIVGRNQITSRLRARAVAYGSDGEVLDPPPHVPGAWHESLRYYRVSESSGDLFDSFRNLYLALEALLSHVVPPEERADGSPEGDSNWLKRALQVIGREFDLAPYAPISPKEPWNAIHEELYRNLRTAIFHAKTGRDIWIPQDWASRPLILKARLRYANLFRVLAGQCLNAGYPSGGLTQAGRQLLMDEMHRDAEVFVSNDRTAVEEELTGKYQLAPAGGAFVGLPTQVAHEMAGDSCRGVAGVEAASIVHKALGEIRRFGTMRGGELMVIEGLRAPLVLHGVDDLQVVLLVETRDYGAPRQDFES